MSYELTAEKAAELTANPAEINPAISSIDVRVADDWTGETALFFRVRMKKSFQGAATAAVGKVLGTISVALQRRAQSVGIRSYVEFTGGTVHV